MTRPMTPRQIDQLIALVDAKARTYERAIGPYDGRLCEPMLMGLLRGRGLVESKVRRKPGGSQVTVYWLTGEGWSEGVRRRAARSAGQ